MAQAFEVPRVVGVAPDPDTIWVVGVAPDPDMGAIFCGASL